jgi:hypothetical protein
MRVFKEQVIEFDAVVVLFERGTSKMKMSPTLISLARQASLAAEQV